MSPDRRYGAAARCVWVGLLTVLWAVPSSPSADADWEVLEPGLELRTFTSPEDGDRADDGLTVLRIDPEQFDFKLFNASAEDNVSLTPKQWGQTKGLVAVINASMFQKDLLTSVSHMRTEHHVNNAYVSKDNTFLGFDPSVPDAPAVKIIDRQCDDAAAWRKNYKTVIQSIRMISCRGENVWRSGTRRASVSALAVDSHDRVLFIHAQSESTTRDLIDLLMQLPLDIARAMYLEGGPQAQLFVDSGNRSLELAGRHPLFGQGGAIAWPLPNVIGITRKTTAP